MTGGPIRDKALVLDTSAGPDDSNFKLFFLNNYFTLYKRVSLGSFKFVNKVKIIFSSPKKI